MGKKGKLQPYLGGIVGFFLILGLLGPVRGTPPNQVNQRADVIRIDLTAESSGKFLPSAVKKQMSAVTFFHDRHTGALEGDTCRTCHLTKDDRLTFLFKRLEIGDPELDREIYHTSCIGCHADLAATGKSSGPLSGNCRGCHSRSPETDSSWVPLIFNPSLHYRHESAELIPPDPDTKTNCSACHHLYDSAIQKTSYIKGEENSCQYCHPGPGKTDGRLMRPNRFGTYKPITVPASPETPGLPMQTDPPDRAIRFMSAAAHDACVACHRKLSTAANRTAGPTDCAGCHTVEAQKKIKVLETVPRMKRNQPDAVLMAAWLYRDDLSPEAVSIEIDPVAFNHKVHESHAIHGTSCRRCHHNALSSCGDCHTRKGATKGDFIGINQALHDPESTRTCIGCHLVQTTAKIDCAGCHAARPRTGFGDQNCLICHGVDKTKLPVPPIDKTVKSEIAANALITRTNNHKAAGTLPPLDQIPERVRIDAMVDTYEAVDLPHRKIILELDRRIQNSGLAQTFHPDPLTMCAGCHHKSTTSLKPPKCASCHSQHQPGPGDGRPALMGAYHIQCMGCHRQMGIQKPQATACNECHPKRDKK
jgi:hypothetical protein